MNAAIINLHMAFGTFDCVLSLKRFLRHTLCTRVECSRVKSIANRICCVAGGVVSTPFAVWGRERMLNREAVMAGSGLQVSAKTGMGNEAGKTKRADLNDRPAGNLVAGAGFEPTTFGL